MKPYLKVLKLCVVLLLGFFFVTSCMKEEVAVPADNASIESREVSTASGLTSDTKLYGIAGTGELVTYTVGPPAQKVSAVPITGLKSGESIVAIDTRPSNGQLYGFSNQGNLYRIDPTTGGASLVSASPISPTLLGNTFAMAFDPTKDQIRIVTESGKNYTVNPDTGALVSSDGTIYPNTAVINAMSYGKPSSTSGTSGTTMGSTPTTVAPLYAINTSDDKLSYLSQKGTMQTIGSTTLDVVGEGGFDVTNAGTVGVAVLNAKQLGNWTSPDKSDDLGEMAYRVYTVDLRSGKATSMGRVEPMTAMALK